MNEITVPTHEASVVEDLNSIADKLKSYIGDRDDLILQDVADQLNKRPSFFERLFPSPLQKQIGLLRVEHLKLLFEDQSRFFKFHSDLKMMVAKVYASALVASLGMGLQTKLAEYADVQIERLSMTIDQSRERFLDRMAPQLKNLEKYRDFPELAEPAHMSMKKEIGIFFDTQNMLLEGFIESLRGEALKTLTA